VARVRPPGSPVVRALETAPAADLTACAPSSLHHTPGGQAPGGERLAPVLEAHRLEGRAEGPLGEPVAHRLPGLAGVAGSGDAGAREVVPVPAPGALLGRRHEHQLRPPRMVHEEVGIAADRVVLIRPLLPGLAPVGGHVHADARGDIHRVGVPGIDHRAVHVVVHPRDHVKRPPRVRALQEAALLDAHEQGLRVVGVDGDVLGVGHVRWGRETPVGGLARPQPGQLGPVAAQVVAREQVRRLRPGKDPRAPGQSGAGEAVDVGFGEALIAALPGVAAIDAGVDRAVVHPREDGAALGLDQEGVDVLAGQRPVTDAPSRAAGLPLHAHHSLDRAHQHVPGAGRRPVDRGAAVREGDRHGCAS
jgi:hypothetical protein